MITKDLTAAAKLRKRQNTYAVKKYRKVIPVTDAIQALILRLNKLKPQKNIAAGTSLAALNDTTLSEAQENYLYYGAFFASNTEVLAAYHSTIQEHYMLLPLEFLENFADSYTSSRLLPDAQEGKPQ